MSVESSPWAAQTKDADLLSKPLSPRSGTINAQVLWARLFHASDGNRESLAKALVYGPVCHFWPVKTHSPAIAASTVVVITPRAHTSLEVLETHNFVSHRGWRREKKTLEILIKCRICIIMSSPPDVHSYSISPDNLGAARSRFVWTSSWMVLLQGPVRFLRYAELTEAVL